MPNFKELELFIFDMDGTLVDSALNFDAMRTELNFPKDASILEHIETLAEQDQRKAFEVVDRHESEGADRATEMPGVTNLLESLKSLQKKTAVLTRNSKTVTDITLQKFDWDFDIVLTRDCISLQKPHPEGLLKICSELNIEIKKSCYIGDYKFDLEAATNAGMFGVLYDQNSNSEFKDLADYTYSNHQELLKLLK